MAALPGLQQLQALIEHGPRPPISRLTGMLLTDVGPGEASFSMPASRWLLSPQGVISCGTLAMLADGPLGCAVHSALPAATAYATSELSLRLLRPARAGATLVARGRLVHAGRSLALSTVQIVDDAGRLIADGSSLCPLRAMRGVLATGAPGVPDAMQLGEPEPEQEQEPAGERLDPWERPVRGEVLEPAVWERMSGLDILRGHVDGTLPAPPIHHLTGLRPVQAASGEASFALPCHEWLCSPLGTVEGGAIAMLADGALVSAIQTTAPTGAAVAAIDLKVNFLRPVRPDGRELHARGLVRHAGRTICVAEAQVVDADGKMVALATGSAMVLAGRAAALAADPAE